MTIEQILDYVMHSPENTNRAVLESMLNTLGGSEMYAVTFLEKYDYDLDEYILSCDKTYEEIYEKISNNENIQAYLVLDRSYDEEDIKIAKIQLSTYVLDSDKLFFKTLQKNYNDEIELHTIRYNKNYLELDTIPDPFPHPE